MQRTNSDDYCGLMNLVTSCYVIITFFNVFKESLSSVNNLNSWDASENSLLEEVSFFMHADYTNFEYFTSLYYVLVQGFRQMHEWKFVKY